MINFLEHLTAQLLNHEYGISAKVSLAPLKDSSSSWMTMGAVFHSCILCLQVVPWVLLLHRIDHHDGYCVIPRLLCFTNSWFGIVRMSTSRFPRRSTPTRLTGRVILGMICWLIFFIWGLFPSRQAIGMSSGCCSLSLVLRISQ